MAKADYRLCDVCGDKVFYDRNLTYEDGPPDYRDTAPYRIAGEPTARKAARCVSHHSECREEG